MNENTTHLHPAFLTRMEKMLGNEYPAFLSSFSAPRTYGLRINTSKITCEDFENLSPFPTRQIPWIKNGYFYDEDIRPSRCPYYQAGLYYLQEPSAMTPASRIPIEPQSPGPLRSPGRQGNCSRRSTSGTGASGSKRYQHFPRQSPPSQPGTLRHPKCLRSKRNTCKVNQSIPRILRQDHPGCSMLRRRNVP